MALTQFKRLLARTVRQLCSRKAYLFCMIVVPVGMAFFFLSLLGEGLPLDVPTAVVDLDNSTLSRNITRNLSTVETIDISMKLSSFDEAMEKVRGGEIFGFFYIPENLQRDALAGNNPTISYYSNMTYFVPGTLAYKGFKTMAVTASGAIVQGKLVDAGVGQSTADVLLQPVIIDLNGIGNPWMNYSYYLTPSFMAGVLELMIFLVTVFSICSEMKEATSQQWLRLSNGSIVGAVMGKLLPQTVIFWIVGLFINVLLYKFYHFPMNGSMLWLSVAMLIYVPACQGFALLVVSVVPNMRLALSICSLTGILAFSIAAFSFPVQSMYGAVGIFSYILPVRYYFLIYIDQALNGIDIYYSRYYFAALLMFIIIPFAALWNLRRHALKPVYIP
ncbi:MAG: ABC transporter permease [Muribaculaceae bacterium]|nr:ABC transporter permease [Muribaculaceae bacterium]